MAINQHRAFVTVLFRILKWSCFSSVAGGMHPWEQDLDACLSTNFIQTLKNTFFSKIWVFLKMRIFLVKKAVKSL